MSDVDIYTNTLFTIRDVTNIDFYNIFRHKELIYKFLILYIGNENEMTFNKNVVNFNTDNFSDYMFKQYNISSGSPRLVYPSSPFGYSFFTTVVKMDKNKFINLDDYYDANTGLLNTNLSKEQYKRNLFEQYSVNYDTIMFMNPLIIHYIIYNLTKNYTLDPEMKLYITQTFKIIHTKPFYVKSGVKINFKKNIKVKDSVTLICNGVKLVLKRNMTFNEFNALSIDNDTKIYLLEQLVYYRYSYIREIILLIQILSNNIKQIIFIKNNEELRMEKLLNAFRGTYPFILKLKTFNSDNMVLSGDIIENYL